MELYICSLFVVRPELFYLLIYKPLYCNFPESRKKNSLIIFFILSADSKYYLFC